MIIKMRRNRPAHFWHFMMGEFLPVVSIIARTKSNKIILYHPRRKWNTFFDKFYEELQTNKTKIIFRNGSIKNKKMIRHQRWDYGWNGNGKNLCRFAIRHLKILMTKKYKPEPSGGKILCLYRDEAKGDLKKMFGKKVSVQEKENTKI